MTPVDWGAIAFLLLAAAFIIYRVLCGDFDNTPYPAMNGTKLEQAIREMLAESRKVSQEELDADIEAAKAEYRATLPRRTRAESKEEE